MKMQVASVAMEPGEVCLVELKHPGRTELPAFEAGSHVDVHLPDGGVRQYSLMNDPSDRSRYVIGIKREAAGRGGSNWLHLNLQAGREVPVAAPRNHFSLRGEADHNLLLAGGIGVTPMLSMARSLKSRDQSFELHYFARSRGLAPFIALLTSEFGPDELKLHLDDEPGTACDVPRLLADRPGSTHLYYCGPPGFMAWVKSAAAHWPKGTVHFEAFNPVVDEAFLPEPFTIQLQSDGRRLEVPAAESALSVLRSAGIMLPSSCENGVCRSCECKMVTGDPIHRDAVLDEGEKDWMFIPCVSRAKGTIVLGL